VLFGAEYYDSVAILMEFQGGDTKNDGVGTHRWTSVPVQVCGTGDKGDTA